jgi:hypothetical protein
LEILLNDYSTILMRIEQSVKTLDKMCLNKQYTGFYSEINKIISDLIGLSHWIGQEQVKQSQQNRS